MKKFVLASLLLTSAAAAFTSCKDDDKDPAPSYTSVGLVKATVDAVEDTFDLARSQASVNALAGLDNPTRPVFKFTVDLYSQRDVKITKVYVYKTLRRGATSTVYTYGPRVLAREVTTFPTTLTFDSQDVLTGLQRIGTSTFTDSTGKTTANAPTLFNIKGADDDARNTVFSIDAVVFTYEYDVEVNGETRRIILTPTNKVNIIAPSTQQVEVISGAQINPPFAVVAPFR